MLVERKKSMNRAEKEAADGMAVLGKFPGLPSCLCPRGLRVSRFKVHLCFKEKKRSGTVAGGRAGERKVLNYFKALLCVLCASAGAMSFRRLCYAAR
jgi:hypothetical protein